MDLFVGIAIPFIGTTLGAMLVFFMKNQINNKIEKTLLGFASGVMIAASVWSLIIPSIEMTQEQGKISWIPATIGFVFGILFLIIIDVIIPNVKIKGLKKETIFMLAVTIHNIPEESVQKR